MARESQPPPPLLVADLHEKIDELQKELQEAKERERLALDEAHKLASLADDLQIANARAHDQLEMQSTAMEKLFADNNALHDLIKERDGEIKYLQAQLEEAVAELQATPRHLLAPSTTSANALTANRATSTPMKMVQDMKDRLKNIEDKLSAFKLHTVK